MKTSLPLAASCSRKKPPPPMPELIGSTTDSAADTAMAASKALPPSPMTSSPASVASACAEAMATPGGVACAGRSASARAGVEAGARSQAETAARARARNKPDQNFMLSPVVRIGCASRRRVGGRRALLLQPAQLGQQLHFGFRVVRVGVDALDRTHFHALRLVEMADALGAQRGIDHVNGFALRDRPVGTDRFADVAVDAELVDPERHMALTAVPAWLAGTARAEEYAPAYFSMKTYSTPAGATTCSTRSLSAASPMNSTRTPSMLPSGTGSNARTTMSATRLESWPA